MDKASESIQWLFIKQSEDQWWWESYCHKAWEFLVFALLFVTMIVIGINFLIRIIFFWED